MMEMAAFILETCERGLVSCDLVAIIRAVVHW